MITTKGNKVIIELEIDPAGKPSSSGKTIVVGGTGGNKKVTMDDGTEVFVGANAYKKKAE
jgi:hypothetical protein